jgi:hypothetical protein
MNSLHTCIFTGNGYVIEDRGMLYAIHGGVLFVGNTHNTIDEGDEVRHLSVIDGKRLVLQFRGGMQLVLNRKKDVSSLILFQLIVVLAASILGNILLIWSR